MSLESNGDPISFLSDVPTSIWSTMLVVSGTGDQYSAVNIYVLNYVIKPIKYMRPWLDCWGKETF